MIDFDNLTYDDETEKKTEGVINYLMGQVMKKSKGQADPKITRDMLYITLLSKCASQEEVKQVIERLENGR